MGKFYKFTNKLRPGQVYRRPDLVQWSTAVDPHLKQAVEAGRLSKLAGGLYYAPKQTAFGPAPAEDEKLVATFLKGGPFLMASPNAYNGLVVGTTQLHNKTVVYGLPPLWRELPPPLTQCRKQSPARFAQAHT